MNDINIHDIHPVLNQWLEAVEKCNAELMCSLYADNAVLIPLISNAIMNNKDLIRDYFENFFRKTALKVQLFSYDIMHKNGHEICLGNCIFSWMEQNEKVMAKARYSYVMDGGKILIRHSSYWPEV